MAIPAGILSVERPSNTVVKATRTPGVYSVVKRTSKRVPGKKNPVPVEVGVVGKICDGVFIPNPPKPQHDIDFKTYGDFALCDKVGRPILDGLLRFYDFQDARKIYCIAVLRVLHPDIVNDDIQVEYQTSYISEVYRGVPLSPNTVSELLWRVGARLNTVEAFMNDRISQYSGHPTVIDGMLKNNTSVTNMFCAFSRKGRVKGTADINLMYAYDLEVREPVACSVYPGNMLDFTAFRTFVRDHPVKKGFVIMDKGFNDTVSKRELDDLGTGYLVPVKVSSRLISDLDLGGRYTHYFKYGEDAVRCKKVLGGERYYYAFKSTEMKASQEKGYLTRAVEKNSLDEGKYEKRASKFGLIVFESNADLEPKDVYTAYRERWEIEVMFDNYKNIVSRQEVNVHGNYRLFATEFINFLSAVISMRIKNLIDRKKLSNKYTQRQVLRLLSKCAKKRRVKKPDEWTDCARLKYVDELCKTLGV